MRRRKVIDMTTEADSARSELSAGLGTETVEAKMQRLEAFLHSLERHPDYEYATTTGGRKCFDGHAPEGDGWISNVHQGREGWERFDYHEEAYWMRLKPPNA